MKQFLEDMAKISGDTVPPTTIQLKLHQCLGGWNKPLLPLTGMPTSQAIETSFETGSPKGQTNTTKANRYAVFNQNKTSDYGYKTYWQRHSAKYGRRNHSMTPLHSNRDLTDNMDESLKKNVLYLSRHSYVYSTACCLNLVYYWRSHPNEPRWQRAVLNNDKV